VVGGFLVALEAVREWCEGLGALMFLGGERADVALGDSAAFYAVLTFAFAPLICRALCSVNVGDKVRGRGRRAVCKKVALACTKYYSTKSSFPSASHSCISSSSL
jgi:hypothetical protein